MRKSKDEIVNELEASFNELCATCRKVDDEVFNISKQNKWTPAENFKHLLTATRITAQAFKLPKFVHVMLYGKPGRASHAYSKVVDNYLHKLQHGGKASGIYVPRKTNYNRRQLHNDLQVAGAKLVKALKEKWTDEQLDHYAVHHPLLGLVTIRELAYFAIYHNQHHLNTIKTVYLGMPGLAEE